MDSPLQCVANRFWARVSVGPADRCWVHRGKAGIKGYRSVTIGGRRQQAHRWAWELTHGPISPGLIIRHRCPGGDNPGCCNVAHLRLGTHADNAADRESDGRNGMHLHPERARRGPRPDLVLPPEKMARWGKTNGSTRLSESAVSEIRAWFDEGWLQRELADAFGVSQTNISRIVRRATWRQIP